jgi:glutaconyl-CoA decarboxylase subunit alpha
MKSIDVEIERIEYLVDPGIFCPLHSIFDPENEESGSTGVVDGLARINGKWCVLICFNNKWIAGQPDNNLRVTDIAKILNIPLVWIVNCSGVKLPERVFCPTIPNTPTNMWAWVANFTVRASSR